MEFGERERERERESTHMHREDTRPILKN